jgi:glucokinase
MAEAKTGRPPRLLSDIGATNVRFALQYPAGEPEAVVQMAVADHADLVGAIRFYLAGTGAVPRIGAFAVASAIAGDRIRMTNHPWSFSVAETKATLGLDQLWVINDFTAIALSLPRLGGEDLLLLGGSSARPARPLVVIGPGSGLGASGLLPTPAGWYAVVGEGGHTTLPAANEREAAVIAVLRRRFGHVSAERVLSGQGLVNLFQALAELAGRQVGDPTPAEVSEQGALGLDPLAGEALQMFCAMLGTVAGDLTLTLGALGGCYLAGGILPRIPGVLAASAFRRRFEAKGRFRAYLQTVPTWLVLHPTPAFRGLAHLVDRELGEGPDAGAPTLIAHL